MDKFQIVPHLIALAAAYALALPIGWDRERESRSAGLRTFPLVALASCGFIQATESLLADSPEAVARIAEGIIAGIGFIGGGAILKQGTSVHGTATAASIWATGAIGLAVGLGSYDVAITVSVFTFLTLKLLPLFKQELNAEEEKNPGSPESPREPPEKQSLEKPRGKSKNRRQPADRSSRVIPAKNRDDA